jgi:uncharacterized membrane protein
VSDRARRGTKHADAGTLAAPRTTVTSIPSRALQENVEAIQAWEQKLLHRRSRAEQLSDWITDTAASGPVLAGHVVWFALWALINTGTLALVRPFDRFPFPLLTMVVSLEAIFLALFVLASQNRLARQADKRAHLDLQIDLLAEREMTAVLQLLQDIAAHLQVKGTLTPDQIRDLVTETDLHALTRTMDDLADEGQASATAPPRTVSTSSDSRRRSRSRSSSAR